MLTNYLLIYKLLFTNGVLVTYNHILELYFITSCRVLKT